MDSNIKPYRPLEMMLDENLTRFEFKDFIGVWENFVPPSFCEELIKYYKETIDDGKSLYFNGEKTEDIGYSEGQNMYGGSLNRKDQSFMLNYINSELSYQVNQFLFSCTQHYVNEYNQLSTLKLVSSDQKFQRTKPGGGYHVWHYENASANYALRELTWMIYLNDLPDGEGETEFMYQRRRIKPSVGTVVFFPAAMTHVHKGNTVFTEDKYILTGWHIKA